ncbi:MFS transporter [Nocardia uniformis]|uniref:MFS transporter n=1 Tax=Nocardia uniformis TaxID=53432 RepID=UPI00082FE222
MSTSRIDRPGTGARLPVLVYVLAAGIFLMGTTEFMIVGLLPDVAADLGVDIARAGLLVTAFAVGMILGPPVMALAATTLSTALGLTGPAVLGAFLTATALIPIAVLACTRRRREGDNTPTRPGHQPEPVLTGVS